MTKSIPVVTVKNSSVHCWLARFITEGNMVKATFVTNAKQDLTLLSNGVTMQGSAQEAMLMSILLE